MAKRKSLSTLDIASRLKARNPSTWANQFRTNLDLDKLVSIIAVANLKGGVGKSTIAVNLACELAKHQKVVLIDADLQGTASSWAEQDQLPIEVKALPLEADTDAETWVNHVLGQKADHIIIDCPPHVGPSTFGAIGISDMTLVPVMPSGTDLMATVPAIQIIRAAQSVRRDRGPLCLLVPSRVDRNGIRITIFGIRISRPLRFGRVPEAGGCRWGWFRCQAAARLSHLLLDCLDVRW